MKINSICIVIFKQCLEPYIFVEHWNLTTMYQHLWMIRPSCQCFISLLNHPCQLILTDSFTLAEFIFFYVCPLSTWSCAFTFYTSKSKVLHFMIFTILCFVRVVKWMRILITIWAHINPWTVLVVMIYNFILGLSGLVVSLIFRNVIIMVK